MLKPRDNLNKITPYVPGQPAELIAKRYGVTDVIKLASNENVLGPAVKWDDELQSVFDSGFIYPYESPKLTAKLAAHLQVPEEHFILGNGSDEIIQLLALAYLDPGDAIITSEQTFSQYAQAANLTNADSQTIPLKNDVIDCMTMLDKITPKTKLIFIANPNNPIGTYIPDTVLTSFLKQVPAHIGVVMDEAYFEYATATDYPNSLEFIDAFPNLIVCRTFSKIYGLAGFRIGYGIAHPSTIDTLEKIRPPFNVNHLAIRLAIKALDNTNHLQKSVAMNEAGKQYLYQELDRLGLRYAKTQANFICIDTPIDAKQVFEALCQRGIIIRALTSFGRPNAIRVTIGTERHNKLFVQALSDCLKEK